MPTFFNSKKKEPSQFVESTNDVAEITPSEFRKSIYETPAS